MNIKLFIWHITALALLSAALQTAANAATTTTTVSFASGDKTVTDPYSTNATATTQTNVPVATPGLPQFDAAIGVLTGATVSVSSTRTETISGTSTYSGNKTATFAGNSTAKIVAPDVDNTFVSVTRSQTCSGNGSCSYAVNSTSTATNLNPTTITSLNSYVGTGTVNGITLTLPQLQTNMTLSSSTASGGGSIYTLDWSGTIDATYSYLLHAAPSFDGGTEMTLDLDFGSLAQNNGVSPLAFSLFNTAGDRTGLNLTGISAGTGDTSFLSTDVATLTNLLQGTSSNYNALFNTSTVGNYSASYTLYLSDYLPTGAASDTQYTYTMQLNLTGIVTAVPLPAAVWLFGSGMLGMIVIARRKKA
jgi:hypothetical protein